jgi:hypothetical protein
MSLVSVRCLSLKLELWASRTRNLLEKNENSALRTALRRVTMRLASASVDQFGVQAMKRFSGFMLLSVACSIGLPLAANDEGPLDLAPDHVARVEQDLFHPPVRLKAADGVIDSGPSWGHSGPWVEDVDGDRVRDLIVGDFSGLFRFYRNEGMNREPRYAKAINLQAGGVDAKVPIY